MAPDKSKPEEAIFKAAIQVEAPEARRAYVLEACGSDRQLLAEVEALLQYHEARSFLDAPVLDPEVRLDEPVVTEGPGTVIGRYKLLEKIGEGGMAVVYMAEQEQPIRRKVALKIIKLGMDTRQVIARFEAERQALALMDHPCIAKVLDAGATETGRPYFAMELVTGVSITEYCDKNRLSTKERLALFLQVCQAVQHAHTKGIIHRDIKPSNVMVTHHDGRPVPKVIDFGIAKATNQKLTEKTLFTRYAHIIGTPAYMSPEQALVGANDYSPLPDIDTRSDIYSLGVLLYELLTGTTPFSEEELRQAGYIEMQRVIREQEPVKPSTKLSTLGQTLTDVAKCHNCMPELLRKAIRGDLDWIVMKSLEKDRVRRYETASGLAEDIRRHLESEPVLARGPTAAYRLGKFLRRHRPQVLAAVVLVVLAVMAGVILSLWNRARLQLAEAEGPLHEAILSRAQGQDASGDHEGALTTIQPILHSRHVGGKARLLRTRILVDNHHPDEAVTLLKGLLHEPPEVAGAAYALWARILSESEALDAGKLEEIERLRQQAALLLPKTAEAYFQRAMMAATIKEQLAALDEALRLERSHYESLRLRTFIYYASRKYEKMRDDALGMTYLRPADPLGYSLHAIALRELSKYEEALAEYDKAMILAPQGDAQYLDLATQRCETLLRTGDYERVVADAQACLRQWPDKPALRHYLFCAQTALGEYDRATTLFRQIIGPSQERRREFENWCGRYVFDTLEAGRSWHPADREPAGPAFLPMVEAEEVYQDLSAGARRIITNGFGAQWSPDGKKLAFSLGVYGYSGIAVFDPETKKTDLLIVPGRNPRWSPDGQHIAFVRDCQVLRLEELTAPDPKDRERLATEEEIWLIKPDGTDPKRLARGGCPSWGPDSTCVYYHSHVDHMLCSISIERRGDGPKEIAPCSDYWPGVSRDGRQMAYLEAGLLKVQDLASQAVLAQWPAPPGAGGATWSPAGDELCLGANGVWFCRLDQKEPIRVLGGKVTAGSWTTDRTKFVFSLGWPRFEIWSADLPPHALTSAALGPGQTLQEHFRRMVALYTRRIEADPQDAYAHAARARYYDFMQERAKVKADMQQWRALVSQGLSSGLLLGLSQDLHFVLDGPSAYQLVFSVGRWENGIHTLCVAFGQEGRSEMKSFEIPMVVASLLSFCLLSGPSTPTAHASFTFGEPTNLGPAVNSATGEIAAYLSPNGLELYFFRGDTPMVARRATPESEWGTPSPSSAVTFITSDGLTCYMDLAQSGGSGQGDLGMATRITTSDSWGTPVNLGGVVNSASDDFGANVSPDGLELYFTSNRPGGYGGYDLWVAKRATVNDPWGTPVNLGPEINRPADDNSARVSPDGLLLFLASRRAGGYGSSVGPHDIYMARRATTKDPWGPPVNCGPVVNSPYVEWAPSISADGSMLYFHSNRPGGFGYFDLWQVPIVPTVDFSGDGKIDLTDLVMLIDNWGTANTLYDIGPMPWGDGKVDMEDLRVFMTYYEKENPPAQP